MDVRATLLDLTPQFLFKRKVHDLQNGALAIFVLVLSFSANAEFLTCQNDGNGKLQKLYLNVNYVLNEYASKNYKDYGIELGAEHTRFCLTENIVASVAGKIYYRISEIRLKTESDKTTTIGFGLTRLEYNKWTTTTGVTPYLMLDIEKLDTEKTDNSGVEKIKYANVFVWGIGIETKLNDVVTFDLFRLIKLDQLSNTKLFGETAARISINLLKLN